MSYIDDRSGIQSDMPKRRTPDKKLLKNENFDTFSQILNNGAINDAGGKLMKLYRVLMLLFFVTSSIA
ncbi:hypothetical protein, partial [Candidatus Symbiopectobacterium sp. NZEC135]|uniref:hypothetical protein n=1 Tax=Candidatus Symbiopectobacterium sp. NZEC135 TaxID=2820471 RepID=UPI0022270101